MHRGTLRSCVDTLAKRPAQEHSLIFAIVHFPKSKCYTLFNASEFATHINSTTAKDTRVLFRGALNEAAHFVLNQQLSLLVTEDGWPHLDDNQTPPLEPDKRGGNGNGDGA